MASANLRRAVSQQDDQKHEGQHSERKRDKKPGNEAPGQEKEQDPRKQAANHQRPEDTPSRRAMGTLRLMVSIHDVSKYQAQDAEYSNKT